MKLARYRTQDGTVHYGSVVDNGVRQITGDPFGQHTITSTNTSLSQVKLLPPCQPTKAMCLALNYRSHIGIRPTPKRPEPFIKMPSSFIGTEDTIVLPKDSKRVDAEGELVVVFGKRCHQVSEKDSWDYILGYTCGNDVSEREWQSGADRDAHWWRAKSADTFGAFGPWIVTDFDPLRSELMTRVNGQVKQREKATDMIYGIPETIAFLSRYVTFEPGDLLYMGTPGTTEPLKHGDVVEVEIPGIGTLRNPVILEK